LPLHEQPVFSQYPLLFVDIRHHASIGVPFAGQLVDINSVPRAFAGGQKWIHYRIFVHFDTVLVPERRRHGAGESVCGARAESPLVPDIPGAARLGDYIRCLGRLFNRELAGLRKRRPATQHH
jgi:hypothetical protein